MSQRISKFFKVTAKSLGVLILCLFLAYAVAAAPTADEYFLRVEVKADDDVNVEISAPLSLINTFYDTLPKECRKLCKELKLTPDRILEELESLDGEDIVRVTGEEEVRVWIAPVTQENRKELGFVRIHVQEDEHDIKVCVPRGLVQLAGQAIKSLGLVDKYVEIPPEIKNLKIVEESEEA